MIFTKGKFLLIIDKCLRTTRKNHDFSPLFERARKFNKKIAIKDYRGSYSYGNLFNNARELSKDITERLGGKIRERVLFLCSNDANYVVALWAIWMSGQTAVPVSAKHPEDLLDYYAKDTNAGLLVSSPEHREIMWKVSKRTGSNLLLMEENFDGKSDESSGESAMTLPSEIYEYSDGLILYTSGTTGKPKGVVLPHKTLYNQTKTLLDAWKWSEKDTILHTLPLHHVHGIVNALFCPLYVGASIVMLPKFDETKTWSYLLGKEQEKITVFMAVPTIYSKLVEDHEKLYGNSKEELNNVRLMVSGSAPLPVPLHQKWFDLTGHKLLERYGMTEIGMCLSNEYDSDRKPGFVGLPLPDVSVRLVDDDKVLLECTNNNGSIQFNKSVTGDVKGELLVKGPNVFKEYFKKPDLTKKEFTMDGWFKTGDVCEYSFDDKKFKMLGRKSADIIKSGGYKLSALQIETCLLEHPQIKECVVFGIPDETWGEQVAAVVILSNKENLSLDDLKIWAKGKMAEYSLPRILKIIDDIPRNAMGKVNKKEIAKIVFV